jgi:hypothetical protein
VGLLERSQDGRWLLNGGKHDGRDLESVAATDPSYLTWIWNEKKIYDFLPDDAAYALDDAMTKFGVSRDRSRRG